MTNMTFTKRVGTPKYMAPEVLEQEKYTKSADVFSFGVTTFEVFGWFQAYPLDIFKFPSKIAEFVMSGKRFDKKENIPKKYLIRLKCAGNKIPKKEKQLLNLLI
ncbi:protein serine/threonine kinase, putative [Entamoeba invadens IP1]|uniref:Protein serine/threonine kinase, putative n=1 Tax=Entamoeba invadens IP1 TaxID=370355 RepID=A0A0A1TZS8_ENTIV|nr:protein serine/threonine kinase, putative [Entamoeba invadens IP1]ELP84147.1 protein serine/threonine kinase, putative [Entamoeba invadens IP1]|eukprot:XP_004183493.1 protein serine/threonine kinase, putative [Entamoeba invadens IP1]